MSTRKEVKKADGMKNTVHLYDYDCYLYELHVGTGRATWKAGQLHCEKGY